MSIHPVQPHNQRDTTKQNVATPDSSSVASFKARGETQQALRKIALINIIWNNLQLSLFTHG